MSKRSANRSAIKKKRQAKCKSKKLKGKIHACIIGTNQCDRDNVLEFNNKQQEVNELKSVGANFQTDGIPSTSRDCQKQISPWRNAGGTVNSFKKILGDQSRKLVKRSVFLTKGNKSLRKYTPLKIVSKHHKKNSKNRKKRMKTSKRKVPPSVIFLEEEIFANNKSAAVSNAKTNEEDENDCFVVEPYIDEITIEDDNDNVPPCSNVSSTYQSLVHSFNERVSSTPLSKKNLPEVENSQTDRESPYKPLPFFVDVCGHRSGLESINSTDTFMNFSNLSTLGDKRKRRSGRLIEKSCNEIINLDDSQIKDQSVTLKPETDCEDDEDSVIFVSETNNNDFIPIEDNTVPPHKKLKVRAKHNTPVSGQRITSLFTLSETKKLNKYNENAYNPSADKTSTNSKRMVIIDGSNVAFKHGLDQSFSVKGLKIAIEYFEKMGHEVKAVIPQFRMNKNKSSDRDELERLHRAGKIVQTPCKNLPGLTSTSYDDRFILQLAFELDAAIVSNDNYRDLLHENPAFRKIIENRVIGYTWCNDIFILPKDPYGKWGPSLNTILKR